MKKNYLFSLIATLFVVCSINAQFTDDFEAYPVGTYHGGHWSSWSGAAGGEDIIVSTAMAFEGTKSGLIGGSTTQDAILMLGNKTTGQYSLEFQAYIPVGKSGYMNLQGTLSPTGAATGGGTFNSANLIFNNVQSTNGAPGLGGAYGNVGDPTAIYTWTYPEGVWFPISIVFDLTAGTWTMSVDGTTQASRALDAENVVGGVDFYSFNANNEMYIDDIVFAEVLSVGEASLTSLKVWPNPVTDYLNLSATTSIDSVEVYGILGQQILKTNPEMMSTSIDLRHLASGSYLVKIISGHESKTIKILK